MATSDDKRMIRGVGRLIHPTAWKRDSQKFAVAISGLSLPEKTEVLLPLPDRPR